MRRRSRSSYNYGQDIMADLGIYRYQRLMLKKLGGMSGTVRFFFGLSLALSFLLYGWLAFTVISNPFESPAFTQLDKCPACYGTHVCPNFHSGEVSFSGLSRLRFLHFLYANNVFFGYYGDKTVAIKRLAQTNELQALDERICMKGGLPIDCDVTSAISKLAGQSGTKWILQKVKGQTEMMTCPSERLLETIMHYSMEKLDAVDLSAREKMQLVTTLLISGEPAIIQTFSQEQGFPFPKYYGACGRMVVEEYVGKSLDHYISAPWETRARLAYQVLKMAERFTDNKSQFGLYWTDLTFEKLAVDDLGQLKVVNAQGIIVVDRWQVKKDQKPGWDQPYYVDFERCRASHPTCIPATSDDLCARHVTDHNYYMVCNQLLSRYASFDGRQGGLLHSVPEELDKEHGLSRLVEECAKPDDPDGRIKAKDALLDIMRTVTRPRT